MSCPVINKWFFYNFKNDLQNLRYLKQLPFITFSDIQNPRYDIIEKIFDKINYNKELLVSIGENKAPFGITINPTNDKELEQLLNSAKYAFVLTDRADERDYLLKCVLCGVMPICDQNQRSIKKLGLKSFATVVSYENCLDLLCKIKYYNHIYDYRINLLAWKYRLQLKKWNKKFK